MWWDDKKDEYILVAKDEMDYHVWYEQYEKYMMSQKQNKNFKQNQRNKANRKKKAKKEREVKSLTCEWCGYHYEGSYYGNWMQNHGDNCKHKPKT
jgi:hypothetical protein